MIRAIRIDGTELLLNIDLIRSVERGETTVVIMTDGERIPVKNIAQDIWEKILANRQGLEEEQREYDVIEEDNVERPEQIDQPAPQEKPTFRPRSNRRPASGKKEESSF